MDFGPTATCGACALRLRSWGCTSHRVLQATKQFVLILTLSFCELRAISSVLLDCALIEIPCVHLQLSSTCCELLRVFFKHAVWLRPIVDLRLSLRVASNCECSSNIRFDLDNSNPRPLKTQFPCPLFCPLKARTNTHPVFFSPSPTTLSWAKLSHVNLLHTN